MFNTIDPMLSEKTNFGNILSRLRQKQKQFAETLEKDNPAKSSLALTFPAFTCEVKLDGERMLAHMKKGVVKIQVCTALLCFSFLLLLFLTLPSDNQPIDKKYKMVQ